MKLKNLSSLLGIMLLLVATGSGLPQQDYGVYSDDDYEGSQEEEGNTEPITIPTFRDTLQDFSVEVNGKITFPCNADNPSDYVMIFKYISPQGKDRLLFAGELALGKQNNRWVKKGSSYQLNRVRKSDKGEYECRFETADTVVLKHTLDVQYPAEVIRDTPDVQIVRQGERITMACSAEGNPPPAISWSRQDGHLPSGAQSEEDDSITLEDVDRHVEGTYICTASNGIGAPSSTNMVLQVEYKPEIITEQAIIHTGEGDEAELVCIVHGRPQPRVSWVRGESLVSSSNHLMTHDGSHRHTLTINNVADGDFGPYTCVASNDFGEAEKTLRLTGIPKPPKMRSSPAGAESDTYTLAWETESFAPIMQYRIKFKRTSDEDGGQTAWLESSYLTSDDNETLEPVIGGIFEMKHTLTDLDPATDYEAIIIVENKFGWSESPQIFKFYTKKEDPTTSTTTTTTTTTTQVPPPPGPTEDGPKAEEVAVGHSASGASPLFTTVLWILLATALTTLLS